MGWDMPWYTITDDFDEDFGVGEWHGTNAFLRDGDEIFRTYFVNERGDEALGSAWSYLDMSALGRQEEWEDSPDGYPQTPPYEWWNLHDEYDGCVVTFAHVAASRWRSSSPRGAGRPRATARGCWHACDAGPRTRAASSAPSRRPPSGCSTRGPARR